MSTKKQRLKESKTERAKRKARRSFTVGLLIIVIFVLILIALAWWPR
jgi:Na+-driven multidrug efflux pump